MTCSNITEFSYVPRLPEIHFHCLPQEELSLRVFVPLIRYLTLGYFPAKPPGEATGTMNSASPGDSGIHSYSLVVDKKMSPYVVA